MIEFPTIKKSEVVVLRAEVSTGHVLNENFHLALPNDPSVYTVFSDEFAAVEYVRGVLKSRDDVEFVVYGSDKNVLHYISP